MEIITAFLGGHLENVFAFGVMVLVTLAIVIMIHEWGHYIAARICGVHIEQFAFGFGREIIGFGKDPTKTRFSICLFPLGGYVKLFGDVDVNNPVVWDHDNECERKLTDQELKTAFCTKTPWQRVFIVAAGPFINILLTLALLVGLYTIHGQRSQPTTINAVAVESAAHEAGIQIGDKILKMDGEKPRRLQDIYDFTWFEYPPKPHTYTILRDDKELDITFTAKRVEYENKKGVELKHGQTGMVRMSALSFKDAMSSINGVDTKDMPDKARSMIIENLDQEVIIGIPYKGGALEEVAHPFKMVFPSQYNQHLWDANDEHYDKAFLLDPDKKMYVVRLGFFESLSRASFLLKEGVLNSYKVIAAGLKGKNDDPVVSGVGTIGKKVGDSVKAGWYEYIILLATFSFMIGFINLLPIPVLDGGYLLFLFYEIIRGKPVPRRFQDIAMIIGLLILVGIMVFANLSDLLSLMSNVSSD